MTTPLHIGFIPLVDAAALIIAVDKGFAAAEGLDVKLVREVSWSNVRDKLNIGLFDAAHLLEGRPWSGDQRERDGDLRLSDDRQAGTTGQGVDRRRHRALD